MKRKYIEKNFRQKSLDLIEKVNSIIEKYVAAGYDLTLRQLYYQAVAKNYIVNTERSYKNFGTLISDARLAGLVDWDAIVDLTRVTKSNSHWSDPGSIIRSAYESYNMDHWDGQYYRPRVWIEKEALIGIISRTCEQFDVPYLACKGYMSQSAMWKDSRKAQSEIYRDQHPMIIHLGDHDPSGIQMTEDIDNRMIIFGVTYEVRRIALNMDQIEELGPPPNPAKLSDSRAKSYVAKYGYESWELDALTPDYINGLLRDTINDVIDDQEQWEYIQGVLKRHKLLLKSLSDNYELLEKYLNDNNLIDKDDYNE